MHNTRTPWNLQCFCVAQILAKKAHCFADAGFVFFDEVAFVELV